MNIICLGGRVMGTMVAWDLVETFLATEFSQAERHLRRLGKVAAQEKKAASEVGAGSAGDSRLVANTRLFTDYYGGSYEYRNHSS